MLNIGIIGITEVLEPHVKRIRKNKNVNVIGKASVGTSAQLNGFHFSIPEFNRVELIERADILLVDSSSLLPFDMLSEMVKKSKHIFTTEYLKFTIDECMQLEKLADESGSVVQVCNPYFYTPAIQWLNNNISTPLFLDISKFAVNADLKETLYPLLLMLVNVTGINPKKVGVSAFESFQNETIFTNVRLEFGDASVVNLNFGPQISLDEFKVRGYSKDKSISLDFKKETYHINSTIIDFSDYLAVNEFDSFVEAIQNKNRESSNLEDYQAALQLVETIEKKINQFIT